jgi:hypothetical protein
LKDWVSCDVARQKVRSKLNALHSDPERAGQPLDKLGLAETGQTFQEQMAARQQPDQDRINKPLLPKEDLIERAA